MTLDKGRVVVSGYISPTSELDTYATHLDVFGQGGLHSVVDIEARDAISLNRRKEGMQAYIASTQTSYQLVGGTDNSNWIMLYDFGDGDIADLNLELAQDYILTGNKDGIAEASPLLIDTRLDIINLRQDVDRLEQEDTLTHNWIWTGDKHGAPEASPIFIDTRLDIIGLRRDLNRFKQLDKLSHGRLWIGDDTNEASEIINLPITNLPKMGAALFPIPRLELLDSILPEAVISVRDALLDHAYIPNPTFNTTLEIGALSDWFMSGGWLPQVFVGTPGRVNATHQETTISSSLALTQVRVAQALNRLDNASMIVRSKNISFQWRNIVANELPYTLKKLYGLENDHTFTKAQALEDLPLNSILRTSYDGELGKPDQLTGFQSLLPHGTLVEYTLEKGTVLLGGENNIPQSAVTINVDNLPALSNGKVWLGGEVEKLVDGTMATTPNRPIESFVAPNDAKYILQKKPEDESLLPNSQGLHSLFSSADILDELGEVVGVDLSGNILKCNVEGEVSIASGGKIPIDHDYVRPADLLEEVEGIELEIGGLEAEILGLQTEITGIEGEVLFLYGLHGIELIKGAYDTVKGWFTSPDKPTEPTQPTEPPTPVDPDNLTPEEQQQWDDYHDQLTLYNGSLEQYQQDLEQYKQDLEQYQKDVANAHSASVAELERGNHLNLKNTYASVDLNDEAFNATSPQIPNQEEGPKSVNPFGYSFEDRGHGSIWFDSKDRLVNHSSEAGLRVFSWDSSGLDPEFPLAPVHMGLFGYKQPVATLEIPNPTPLYNGFTFSCQFEQDNTSERYNLPNLFGLYENTRTVSDTTTIRTGWDSKNAIFEYDYSKFSFHKPVEFLGTGAVRLPSGTKEQRPNGLNGTLPAVTGMIRFNTELESSDLTGERRVFEAGTAIDIQNPAGKLGNTIISVIENPEFLGSAYMKIPYGTTNERPSNWSVGMLRLNTEI